jgi:hypothetical protein
VASRWRNPEEKPLRQIKLDLPALQEDFRKIGGALFLAGFIGWLLQNGSTNTIFAIVLGVAMWLSGLIRAPEDE